MKCPFCEKELPGTKCDACGTVNPEEARYCMMCGELLKAISGQDDEDYDLDLENRILCPDGTCTGIIVDGKCTECGRPYDPASASDETNTES